MNTISSNCPSCQHPFNLTLKEISPGSHKKTIICENCGQDIRFEYKFNMSSTKKQDRLYVKEDWMRAKYVGEDMTLQEIADICGVSAMTIRDWLMRHNIETRGRGHRGA